MPRYKIWIEYEGTQYCGWQKQPEDPTVQAEIEAALERILREEIEVYGQGRTDSGVHAEGQVAHFDTSSSVDRQRVQYSLNGVLPRDIAVWKMEEVSDAFHARFDATARQYRYQVTIRPRPLWRHTANLVRKPLDRSLLDRCAEWIKGEHDFVNFARMEDDGS